MADETEDVRREMQQLLNDGTMSPVGQTWTTDQLQEDFWVKGFMAPFVVVQRKSDGKVGSLMFRHSPRIYFGWQEDQR